jgi:hypothetical protein
MGLAAGITSFTVGCWILGAFLGFLRARNRSILRLALVILSLVLAISFKGVIADAILGAKIDGKPLLEFVEHKLIAGEASIDAYDGMMNLIRAFAHVVSFIGLFSILNFLTWAIAFPVLKIFIWREKKILSFLGPVIGFVQGLLVAFIICAPICSLMVEANEVAKIEYQDTEFVEFVEDGAISKFADTASAKAYDATGGWLYDLITPEKIFLEK